MQRLKRVAASAEHDMTHRPKNPFCWICIVGKMGPVQARRVDPSARSIQPTRFGELLCADHVIIGKGTKAGLDGEPAGIIAMGVFMCFIYFDSVKRKSGNEATRALRYFAGDHDVKYLYSDNSRELEKAAGELGWSHPTSTPYRPQSNGVMERQVRTLEEGARTALLQAGLPHRFWPLAATHQAVATSITSAKPDTPTPWKRMHDHELPGMILPFGCLVYFRPPAPHLKSMGKFEPTALPGLFVGWHMSPGFKLNGDYLVMPHSCY